MRLLAYIRVSTVNQDIQGFSLDSQKTKITNYSQTYSHEIVDFKEDMASGSKKNKGLKELLKKLFSQENLDGIIVDKLDRLFRSAEEVLKTVRELKAKNKTLISVTEQFDISTAFGQLALTVISGFSEFEKERIKERILTGKNSKKSIGAFTGGSIPFGYKSVDKVIKGKKVRVLVSLESEQKIISLVFKQRESHKSYREIAEFLNENGYKTKKRKKFSSTQVHRILKRFNLDPLEEK